MLLYIASRCVVLCCIALRCAACVCEESREGCTTTAVVYFEVLLYSSMSHPLPLRESYMNSWQPLKCEVLSK